MFDESKTAIPTDKVLYEALVAMHASYDGEVEYQYKLTTLRAFLKNVEMARVVYDFLNLITPSVLEEHTRPDRVVHNIIQLLKVRYPGISGMSMNSDHILHDHASTALIWAIFVMWKHADKYRRWFNTVNLSSQLQHTHFIQNCLRPEGTFAPRDAELPPVNLYFSQKRTLTLCGLHETCYKVPYGDLPHGEVPLRFGRTGVEFLIEFVIEVNHLLSRWLEGGRFQENTKKQSDEFVRTFERIIVKHPEFHKCFLGRLSARATLDVLLNHWKKSKELGVCLGLDGCPSKIELLAAHMTFGIPFFALKT